MVGRSQKRDSTGTEPRVDPHLQHLLIERLAATDTLAADAIDLILAGCEGGAELDAALVGETKPRTVETVQPELDPDPAGAYLASIQVESFRGIGPRAELELPPGPGLTLVIGRNGSG